MKHSSGGITLLFALIVTLFSLGVIFLLNYSLIIGLEVNRIDYINTQLKNNIESAKQIVNSADLPFFDLDNPATIETINTGTIVLKKSEKRAAKFWGQHNYVDFGDKNEHRLSDQFTISIWCMPQNFPIDGIDLPQNNESVLSKGSTNTMDPGTGYEFLFNRYDNNTKARLKFFVTLENDGGGQELFIVQKDNIIDDTWLHCVVTYNGSYLRMFVDGNLVDQVEAAGSVYWPAAERSLFLGKRGGTLYSGMLRNVGLWSVALTDAAVLEMHTKGLNFNPLIGSNNYQNQEDLKAFYRLNETGGLYIYDSSIHQNNGTITNNFLNQSAFTTIADSFSYYIQTDYLGHTRVEHYK
jgi:hypothetical protein